MSIKRFLLAFLLLTSIQAMSQSVGINNIAPDSSAQLDVKSTSRGILVPRMTLAQRIAISAPATGLLVYQTDSTNGFYFNKGTTVAPNWQLLTTGASIPVGTVAGQMLYWNGSAWVTVAPGTNKQTLSYCHGVPTWGTCPYIVGDTAYGGVIGYILQSGDAGYDPNVQHGIIVSSTDQGTAFWGCYGSTTGATGYAIGTGQSNTTEIITVCTSGGIAAAICNQLVLGGYSDWYLPSNSELTAIYQNKAALGLTFSSGYYWTSSESSNFGAAVIDMIGGGETNQFKNQGPYEVRAVRSF